MPKRKRPNIVLDSAILVSAFLAKTGVSAELLRCCEHEARLYTAGDIIQETRRVLLEEQRIRRKYAYEDSEVETFLARLRTVSTVLSDLPELRVIERDPKDDKILACAVAANAQYLVTRDIHLLDVKTHQGITILSPEDIMALLRAWAKSPMSEEEKAPEGKSGEDD